MNFTRYKIDNIGLLKSIISSGEEAPFWLKLSKPNKFRNVSPLLDLSLTGVEKLSTILTLRLVWSILIPPNE